MISIWAQIICVCQKYSYVPVGHIDFGSSESQWGVECTNCVTLGINVDIYWTLRGLLCVEYGVLSAANLSKVWVIVSRGYGVYGRLLEITEILINVYYGWNIFQDYINHRWWDNKINIILIRMYYGRKVLLLVNNDLLKINNKQTFSN